MSIPFSAEIQKKETSSFLALAHECLSYNTETGTFVWKKTGRAAGALKSGYLRIRLSGATFMAHRLAWAMVRGNWPSGVIDHINRDRSDNRVCNLRDVTPTENARNKAKRGRAA